MKRYSYDEWKNIIDMVAQSKEPAAVAIKELGISSSTFYNYKKTFNESPFQEVTVCNDQPTDDFIELNKNGISFKYTSSTDNDFLKKLVGVLDDI